MKNMLGDIIILHMCTINDNHMIYGSRDMEHDRQNFLSFWTIFCPFTPLTTQKIKILKKWKKHLEILSFYTSVPKIMIICYTVPEIWCMTDAIVIFHFRLFFALLPHNSPKNENFTKMKKTHGDITILHKCTKNHDHMLHCSWDKALDRCNCYFSFWAFFAFSCPFTLSKFQKWKNNWRYHHFTKVYQNLWLDNVWFLIYDAWQMDGQTYIWTDRRTNRKSDIQRWVPHLKM